MIHSPQATAPKSGKGTRRSKAYKADQGRLARMAAFWSLALLYLFGCTFLHDQLVLSDSLSRTLGGVVIPVVGVSLTGAFLISTSTFVVGFVWLMRWQQKPKVADMLIETEAELRKVTWPSGQEVINSSLVVMVTVVLLGLFLAGSDYVLARIMKYLILGEG